MLFIYSAAVTIFGFSGCQAAQLKRSAGLHDPRKIQNPSKLLLLVRKLLLRRLQTAPLEVVGLVTLPPGTSRLAVHTYCPNSDVWAIEFERNYLESRISGLPCRDALYGHAVGLCSQEAGPSLNRLLQGTEKAMMVATKF